MGTKANYAHYYQTSVGVLHVLESFTPVCWCAGGWKVPPDTPESTYSTSSGRLLIRNTNADPNSDIWNQKSISPGCLGSAGPQHAPGCTWRLMCTFQGHDHQSGSLTIITQSYDSFVNSSVASCGWEFVRPHGTMELWKKLEMHNNFSTPSSSGWTAADHNHARVQWTQDHHK